MSEDTVARSTTLSAQVHAGLEEIHQNFSEILNEREGNSEEKVLYQAIEEFLMEAQPKFAQVKATLEELKQRYAR